MPSGTLTFDAGETSKTITINVSGDTTGEPDESFTVNLSNATGANLLTSSAAATILDDDGLLSIAADSTSLNEANSGTTQFSFTVTRTGSASVTSTVDFSVSGTGIDPAVATDFAGTFPNGSVTFAPGETTKTITISVSADTTIEANETFTVTLSNPTAAQLLTPSATATIVNDDASLSIAAASASKAEGDTGFTPFTFTVTRTGSLQGTASVSYAVRGSGANPAATADFGGTLPSGTVIFADGEATKTITINVAGNKSVELDEDFTVNLSNPIGASLDTSTATGAIINDDADFSIVSDGNHLEGNSGSTQFTFTITRTGVLTRTASVQVRIALSTVDPNAANAADFVGSVTTTTTLSFAIGETSKTFVVNVAGDTELETNEEFGASLLNAVGATIKQASADAWILNDET